MFKRARNVAQGEEGFTMLHIMGFMVLMMGGTGLTFAGIMNITQDNHSVELKETVAKFNSGYDQWAASKPEATTDEKKAYLREEGSKLKNANLIGFAFDSTKSEEICMWNIASKNKKISEGITTSSDKSNCSAMETVVSPVSSRRNTSNAPVVQAPAAPSAPAPEFPWSMLLGSLATLGTVAGGVVMGVRGKNKMAALKSSKLNSRKKWEAMFNRHDAVRAEWSSYELDPMKMLEYPTLTDMREQTTVNLYAAIRKAASLRPEDISTVSHEDANTSDYGVAVAELENAFHIAETEAKRIQWSKFTANEKKRLKTSKALLNFVLDSSATEFERQAAYKQLQKEIAGLITLPKLAMAEIENQMRVMIEA